MPGEINSETPLSNLLEGKVWVEGDPLLYALRAAHSRICQECNGDSAWYPGSVLEIVRKDDCHQCNPCKFVFDGHDFVDGQNECSRCDAERPGLTEPQALLAIQEAMSGVKWNSETSTLIAIIMERAGYIIEGI